MTAAKGVTDGRSPADRKYLSDAYRQAAFNLLRAAHQLRDLSDDIRQTRVKVARSAITDLGDAITIVNDLPTVPALTKLEKV